MQNINQQLRSAIIVLLCIKELHTYIYMFYAYNNNIITFWPFQAGMHCGCDSFELIAQKFCIHFLAIPSFICNNNNDDNNNNVITRAHTPIYMKSNMHVILWFQ